MEKWFVENKALTVSCNYELVVWAAVWLNQSKQYEDREDEHDQQQRQQQQRDEPQGAHGGLDFTQRNNNMLASPIETPSLVVPHTYTTRWHEILCRELAGQAASDAAGQTQVSTGHQAMDVDSDVDEG